MDQGIPPTPTDVHSSSHRQSILGSFLRRPRGSSQSQQAPPHLHLNVNVQLDNPLSDEHHAQTSANAIASMFNQPPSPGSGAAAGHRRRPAANALQASVSHGLAALPGTSGVGVHGFSQMLRRRRSANGALSSGAPPQSASPSVLPVDPAALLPAVPSRLLVSGTGPPHRIRLVPHLDSNRSLHFDPISRDVREGDAPLRIGRFTDRSGNGAAALNAQNSNKLAFKSKVVSRAHAEVWCEHGGKFFIKDTKSSSGTFLNHMRLSQPNADSKPFPLKDGDVLQLGVDYQGGAEEIYKCVKMRVELGREWQSQPNAFNTNALKQLKALSAEPSTGKKSAVSKSGISDCCICLFSVTVHQSLFIAPCSHVFHYKCIRPLLQQHHPGFSCPLCRTFADLEEDVEVEVEEEDVSDNATGTGGSGAEVSPERDDADPAAMNVSSILNAANEVAAQVNAGAETEVESELAPRNTRRRDGGATLRTGQLPSPMRNAIEDVPEHAEEYPAVMSDTEDGGEMLVLPPLPASAALSIPGAGGPSSASSQRAGFDVVRPMSVPVSAVAHVVLSDDGSDVGADFDMIGLDGDGSGSSGEGIGAGGKRKR